MLVHTCNIDEIFEELHPYSRFTKPELYALLKLYDTCEYTIDVNHFFEIESGWRVYSEDIVRSHLKIPYDRNIFEELDRIGLWYVFVPIEKNFLISGF